MAALVEVSSGGATFGVRVVQPFAGNSRMSHREQLPRHAALTRRRRRMGRGVGSAPSIMVFAPRGQLLRVRPWGKSPISEPPR